ncbi:type IV pilus modification protein PilV [Teredinibacter waterburyi]|jgi:type IV pilus modification protein PilV|uniref:type IV pilus modification protein PilV n=1 Tax=Teredinibacter waterburyi TaxID=1500538 RepID=UPI00165FE08D|nr:type IV pilus modification protein PilV [Teredinibacter waterburyi]
MSLITVDGSVALAAKRKLPSRLLQRGAAMMEVVVSLFILAVGLLGVLAMQAQGLSSNQRAVMLSEADMLAADMGDRILAYNDASETSDDDDYDNINTSTGSYSIPGCVASRSGCTKSDQVAWDAFYWQAQLARRLPSGFGKVDYADGVYTITVLWDHDKTGTSSTSCDALTCYTYQLRL